MRDEPISRPRRRWWTTLFAVVSGVVAVLLLMATIVMIVDRRATVNLDFNFGHGIAFEIHRWSFTAIAAILGGWFALLTRALWQRRQHARVMVLVTTIVVGLLVILVFVGD